MQLIRHERVATWARACLQAVGVPAADAAIVADALVQTSLWGIDSHGVLRLTHYLDRLQRGSTRAAAPGRVAATGPCTASMDGDNGLGILHCVRAMEAAIALARDNGLGVVGVRRSSHCGAVGLYARQAAAAGLVGMAFTQANAIVVPFGGRRSFLGTNPIAIAFPRAGDVPLCLDMATSQVAFNRVINARIENTPVPPGLTVDAQGEPTIDPHAAVAITPLGGPEYGYKGYGLAIMVDLLCGALNGMSFGPHITPMYEALDTPQDLGHLLLALDPQRFAGGSTLAATVRALADELPREPGQVQLPGDPELRSERTRRGSGIPFESGALADMAAWSERLGVTPLA
ncbi:MAG: Ldh family oxidoreductase [Burkholderiaceae bacterium]|jgi:ureidoglycolate dehydrogenase (NAD+)|nr:Ldh family oxidoreductase [Burkholderiaceae bacterium]